MPTPTKRDLTSIARSGVWPAGIVLVLALGLAAGVSDVRPVDLVKLVAYVAVFLTLPGSVLWRLAGGAGRPLFEMLVLGTIVGLAAELPVYLIGRAIGFPWLVAALPAGAIAYLAATRGRDVRLTLRGPDREADDGDASHGGWWTWALGALLGLVAVVTARSVWAAEPVTRLRAPYVDEPFHLALAGELKHHVPADFPWVDGVPLFYHWLTYVHVASASTVTGIEPIVLLRVGSIALFVSLTVLGAAAAVNRLTQRPWLGVLAAGVLALSGAPDAFGWTTAVAPLAWPVYAVDIAFQSPTHAFASALVIPLVVLLFEALRDDRLSWRSWLPLAGLMIAVSGAKSSTLPPIVAGLFLALVVQLVLRTGRWRVPLALFGTSAAVFLIAQRVFYGGNSRSMEFAPLDTAEQMARVLGWTDVDEVVPGSVTAIVAVTFVVALLLSVVGFVGLLPGGRWRRAEHQLLIGVMAAAIGAGFSFGHPGFAQVYFIRGAAPTMAITCAIGISAMLGDRLPRARAWGLLGAGVLGALLTALVAALTGDQGPSGGADVVSSVARAIVLPQVVAALLLGVAALVMALVAHRRGWSRGPVAALVVFTILGAGFVRAGGVVGQLGDWPEPRAADTMIANGGIVAARYIRDHSDPDDLVATNAHCLRGPEPNCDRRNFWMSAYTERHVLVEGWAYIPPEIVGLESTAINNSSFLPFWDDELLAINDRAFAQPSAESIAALQERGVRWMLVDRRYESRVGRLRELAELRFRSGDYVVFEIGG
ncbi:hypothetical protein [Nocardioides humi]|uniref:4-amino-4-deoxy-L-arabinose transferase n=1 Tax=Nocardioides humi TaxID=449461 RepID=A0ABN2ALD5_9ACTN|nr:hypothetical protein [Nocardioides humi]